LDYRQPESDSCQGTETIRTEEKLVYADGEIDSSPSDLWHPR
jgi:hypothetical protein